MYISFGGQKRGSSEPPRTPSAYKPEFTYYFCNSHLKESILKQHRFTMQHFHQLWCLERVSWRGALWCSYLCTSTKWSKSYGERIGWVQTWLLFPMLWAINVWGGSRVKWKSRAGMEDGVELTFIMCWWIWTKFLSPNSAVSFNYCASTFDHPAN